MNFYWIVMADIVRSRAYDGTKLLPVFCRLVHECNAAQGSNLLSPYTITLGDEFQGIARTLRAAIDSIFFLEESLLMAEPSFQLRYVIVHGGVDTPINPVVAHGMTGPGLATAREVLTKKGRGRRKFQIIPVNLPWGEELNMLFRLVELLSSHWKEKDYRLVQNLIRTGDDAAIAANFGKTRSQIWKRRRTLQIEEYVTARNLIWKIAAQMEGE